MGARGEGWVIGQFLIGLAIFFSPLVMRSDIPLVLRAVGIVLLMLGVIIVALGSLTLGVSLTVFPKPRSNNHTLVTTGIYQFVRHPIYAGAILGAFGWSLLSGSVLAAALSVLVFIWLDLKSRREEKWLGEKYPDYSAYQTRVKRLVPYLY